MTDEGGEGSLLLDICISEFRASFYVKSDLLWVVRWLRTSKMHETFVNDGQAVTVKLESPRISLGVLLTTARTTPYYYYYRDSTAGRVSWHCRRFPLWDSMNHPTLLMHKF